jgi:HPt (histidine-containing phosphotransfer) domain-containing protein
MARTDLDIEELMQRMGLEDADDVCEVVGFFIEAATPRLTDLGQAISDHDPAATKHHAHAAKGAAQSVGAGALATLLIGIEEALAADNWPDLEGFCADLPAHLQRVESELESWLKNNPPST